MQTLDIENIEEYLNDPNIKKSTLMSYASNIRAFLAWKNASKNNTSSEQYIEVLKKRNLSIKSINRQIAAINHFNKKLQYEGQLSFLPTSTISIGKAIPDHIVKGVLEAGGKLKIKVKDKLIIEFFLYAGLTSQEICDIEMTHLNQEQKYILVNDNKVPLHEELFKTLSEYLKSRYFKPNNKGLLLYYRNKMTASGICRIINRYDLNPRALRNTYLYKLCSIVAKENNVESFIHNVSQILEDVTANYEKYRELINKIEYSDRTY